jgi:hypothetical protein
MFNPNNNLEEQLRLAHLAIQAIDKEETTISDDQIVTLAECVIALDGWLARGCALPDRWRAKTVKFQRNLRLVKAG